MEVQQHAQEESSRDPGRGEVSSLVANAANLLVAGQGQLPRMHVCASGTCSLMRECLVPCATAINGMLLRLWSLRQVPT